MGGARSRIWANPNENVSFSPYTVPSLCCLNHFPKCSLDISSLLGISSSLHSLSRLPLPRNLYLTEHPSSDPHFTTSDPLSAQVCRTAQCSSHTLSGWLQSVPLFVIPVSPCNTFPSLYASRTDSTLPLVAELNYHHFHEVLGCPKLKQHFSPLN